MRKLYFAAYQFECFLKTNDKKVGINKTVALTDVNLCIKEKTVMLWQRWECTDLIRP